MHVVTISATYGAGGALVGPEVAERLGVPVRGPGDPRRRGGRPGITLDDALSRDEQCGGWLSRLLTATAPLSAEWMIGPDHPRTALLPDSAVLRCTEGVIRRTVGGAAGSSWAGPPRSCCATTPAPSTSVSTGIPTAGYARP